MTDTCLRLFRATLPQSRLVLATVLHNVSVIAADYRLVSVCIRRSQDCLNIEFYRGFVRKLIIDYAKSSDEAY